MVGRQIDRHGGRSALATSSILMSLGLLLMGMASNLGIYYLAWTFIGVAMAAGLYDAAFSTLARLFGESARTSMTGLTLLGAGPFLPFERSICTFITKSPVKNWY